MTIVLKLAVLVLWLCQRGALAQRSPDPNFREYPAVARFLGNPVSPKFSGPDDRWPEGDPKFREAVIHAAGVGPNFAGAFTIVEVSCGTGCMTIAIINQNDGTVFTHMPFVSINVGYDPLKGTSEYRGPMYRLDSRLLVVEGWLSTARETRDRPVRDSYVWTGNQFRLLKRALIRR